MTSTGKALDSIKNVGSNPVVFAAAFALVLAFRLYYCVELPINTGDTVRHISWGIIASVVGYESISRSLISFSSNLAFVSWSAIPYNYPILSLLFDQLCAGIYPSIFTMKVALTTIELLCALLVYKFTNSRLLSFLYWASPISIWWVSHEGQFEPLQNVLVLTSLVLFKSEKYRSYAYVVLGLAVQVKLTAVFLIAYYVLNEHDVSKLFKRCGLFVVAFIPTLLVFLVANPVELLSQSAALRYNPYFYNFFDQTMFLWNPTWLIISNQLATYSLLLSLIGYGFYNRSRVHWAEVLPAILFVVFLKTVPNAQFWYTIPLLVFLLPISNLRLRTLLFIATPLLDLRSTVEMVFGPFGFTMARYYAKFGDGVFTDIRTLF